MQDLSYNVKKVKSKVSITRKSTNSQIIKKIIAFELIEFIIVNYSLTLDVKEFKVKSEDNELEQFTIR